MTDEEQKKRIREMNAQRNKKRRERKKEYSFLKEEEKIFDGWIPFEWKRQMRKTLMRLDTHIEELETSRDTLEIHDPETFKIMDFNLEIQLLEAMRKPLLDLAKNTYWHPIDKPGSDIEALA